MRLQRDRYLGGVAKFFSIIVGQESLFAYFTTNFNLLVHHKIDPTYFDNQTPWEKKVYMAMLESYVKERNEEIQRQQNQAGKQRIQHPGEF